MTQYNTLNVKLSAICYSINQNQEGSSISGISVIPVIPVNTGTKVTLTLSSNVVGYSIGKTNFRNRLL